MLSFFLILLSLRFILLESQCLNYFNSTETCDFCSFQYFNVKDEIIKFANQSKEAITPKDCFLKQTGFINRSILILNTKVSNATVLNIFDKVYTNFLNAFLNENLLIKEYLTSQMIVYFSKGQHYIYQSNFDSFYDFFNRINLNITIKPLYCDEFGIDNICMMKNEKIYLNFSYMMFSLYIANYMELNDVVFEFNQNISEIVYSEENIGFFILNNIIDLPNMLIPHLKLIGCNFLRLSLIKNNNSNKFINVFLMMPTFHASLELLNNTITDFFSMNSLIYLYNNTIPLSENVNESMYFYTINIKNLHLNDFNTQGLNVDLLKTFVLIDLSYFMGVISLNNISMTNFSFVKKGVYLMKFCNINQNVSINSLSFENINRSNLIYSCSVLIQINNIFINNYNWTENSINIINGSSVFIENFTFLYGNCDSDQVYFLYIEFSNLYIAGLNSSNMHNFSISFFYSVIYIKSSFFHNIINYTNNKILMAFSTIIFHSVVWHLITCNILFYYQSIDLISFESNIFLNCTIGTFIYASNVHSLLINNSKIANLQGINNFIGSGSSILYFNFLNSVFSYIKIAQTFINIRISNLLIMNSTYNEILFNNKKANVFMQFQTGFSLIFNSLFQAIHFKMGGNQIFSLKSDYVNVSNSLFLNNGWLSFVDIRTKIALEFIVLFYIWSCYDAVFYNNTFFNTYANSLFSGFIISTLHQGLFTIDSCSFIARNKISGLNYHGVILADTPVVYILNNYFEGLECSNFNSFEHTNGVLSLQGESSVMRKGNKKVAFILNNTFSSCQCLNGGSIGVVNYLTLTIQKIKIFHSKSYHRGGAFEIISCPYVYISDIMIKNTFSNIGGLFYLYNSKYIAINYLQAMQIQNLEGAIYTNAVIYVIFDSLVINGSISSKISGGFLLIGGFNYLSNIQIINNTANEEGGAIFINENAKVFLYNITSDMNTADNGGFLYCLSCSYLEINQSVILNSMAAYTGSSLFFESITNLIVYHVDIINSMCSQQGVGTIYLKSMEIESNFMFLSMNLYDNAAESGSFIYSESQGSFKIHNISIFNSVGMPIYISWSSLINVFLKNISISKTSSKEYLFFFSEVNLKMEEIFLEFNDLSLGICYIEMSNNSEISQINSKLNFNDYNLQFLIASYSNVILKLINIENDQKKPFNLITATNCKISLYNSNFADFETIDTFIKIENSQILLLECSFSNITGPIIFSVDSDININFCKFIYNLYDIDTNVENINANYKFNYEINDILINNSLFLTSKGISLMIINMGKIMIFHSIFTGSSHSQGISINEFSVIFISNTRFSYFFGSQGSALIISKYTPFIENYTNNVFINICKFVHNKADFGGAIYVSNACNSIINYCVFSNNFAYKLAGAVIFLLSKGFSSFINSSNFDNNYADFSSPNIFSNVVLLCSNNSFYNNTDKMNVNSNFSSFPLKFELNSSIDYIEFISGTPFQIYFKIIDFFNQTFFTEKPISATLILDKINNSQEISLGNTISLITKLGEINFQNILIKTNPNSTFYMKITAIISDYGGLISTKTEQIFEFFSRPCQIGEIYTSSQTCKQCEPHFYSLIDPMDPLNHHVVCQHCDNNANCPGGHYLLPLPGYWRYASNSTMINLCLSTFACLGSIGLYYDNNDNNTIMNYSQDDFIKGMCGEGHYGNLCYDCKFGYGKFESNSPCQKCKEYESSNIIRIIFLGSFIIWYIYFIARPSIVENTKIEKVLMKILINHLQKLSLLSFGSIHHMKEQLESFFSVSSKIGLLSEDSFTNDCYIQIIFGKNVENIYLFKVLFIILLPMICSFVALGLFFITSFKNKFKVQMTGKFFVIFFTSTFIFYPLVTKSSLSLLNCIHLHENDPKFLLASPNIICWDKLHLVFALLIGVLGNCIWGFLFPVFFAIHLRYIFNLKMITQRNNSPDASPISMSITRAMARVSKRYSVINIDSNLIDLFFVKDYKNSYYYWESVIFFQKFMIVLVQNIPNILETEIIDIFFIGILMIYFFILNQRKPFKIHQMNFLEEFSIITLILCKILLVLEQAFPLSSFITYLSIINILGLNGLFFSFAIFYLIKLMEWKRIFTNFLKKINSLKSKFYRNNFRGKNKESKRTSARFQKQKILI